MIRFRCRICGKKLKADESIIGRRVQCTNCSNIEIVPPEDRLEKVIPVESDQDSMIYAESDDDFDFSTTDMEIAMSGPKIAIPPPNDFEDIDETIAAAEDVAENSGVSLPVHPNESDDVSLIPNSEPERDDDDALVLQRRDITNRLETAPPSLQSVRPEVSDEPTGDASGIDEADARTPLIDTKGEAFPEIKKDSQTSTSKVEDPTGAFRRKPASKENRTPKVLFGGAILLLACVAAYIFFSSPRTESYNAEFKRLGEVFHYEEAYGNLEKMRRQMMIMGEAYAKSSGDDAEFEDLKNFNASIESYTSGSSLMQEAYDRYKAGKGMESKQMLVDATEELKARKLDVESRLKKYTEINAP